MARMRVRVFEAPEESAVVEIQGRTWRFGLLFEPERWQSGWYLVARGRGGWSGRIPGLGLLRGVVLRRARRGG